MIAQAEFLTELVKIQLAKKLASTDLNMYHYVSIIILENLARFILIKKYVSPFL